MTLLMFLTRINAKYDTRYDEWVRPYFRHTRMGQPTQAPLARLVRLRVNSSIPPLNGYHVPTIMLDTEL